MHIHQTFRNHRQIPGEGPTRAEENPCIIISHLSATKPVWHNQETNTPPRNCQVRHTRCICVLRTHCRSDPTLESSGQTSLLLQQQLSGHKTLDPTTKHQKDTPAKLVLHIYKLTNTNLNTAIGQLTAGAFFFGMRPCKYSKTPKGEDK